MTELKNAAERHSLAVLGYSLDSRDRAKALQKPKSVYHIPNKVVHQGEAPWLYSRGLRGFVVPWSGTTHRKPFIHGVTSMALWCGGKNLSKNMAKDKYE